MPSSSHTFSSGKTRDRAMKSGKREREKESRIVRGAETHSEWEIKQEREEREGGEMAKEGQ